MPTVIVPVGLNMGPQFDDPAGDWHVHLGTRAAKLSPDELRAWGTAFSDVQRHADHTFTRAHLEHVLGQDRNGTPDPAPIVSALLDRGLLLEYDPADADWAELFDEVNLFPLVQGMGNSPEEPAAYQLGVGGEPILSVNANVYGIWSYALTSRSLWSACAELAAGVDQDLQPGEEPFGYNAADIAAEVGAALPLLVTTGCAFLDPATPRPSPSARTA
ncbi:MAG: hypothetical protein J2P24_16605 [Streptosporangiales bacterium]|nr:hypothetical protein [Streptosporangiales bacterium]MBO0889735.1 hypothetical protein [Acidothermales bacterium]